MRSLIPVNRLILWLAVSGAMVVASGQAPATRFTEIGLLRQNLTTALQHDDVAAAAEAMAALLRAGAEPANVALTALSRLSPRSAGSLAMELTMHSAPGMEEVMLLLAAARGDWGAVDSLFAARPARSFTAAALQTVAVQADEAGNPGVAAWAYGRLVAMGSQWANHAVIPLAEALIQLQHLDRAAALLDSMMDAEIPERVRHRAGVMRARLSLRQGRDAQALAFLDAIPGGRPEQADAHLLATLIRFSHEGTESLAAALEGAARLRPDLPEANDAYDVAQLVHHLPAAPDQRRRVLRGLQLELRGHYESAAEGYRDARLAGSWPGAVRIGIREARCWEQAGRNNKALETWISIEASGEDGPVVLIGRGDCFMGAGMADSARACYMAVLEQFPASPHAGRARSRLFQ